MYGYYLDIIPKLTKLQLTNIEKIKLAKTKLRKIQKSLL